MCLQVCKSQLVSSFLFFPSGPEKTARVGSRSLLLKMIISCLSQYSLIVLLLTTLSLEREKVVKGQRIPGGVDHLNRTNSLDVTYYDSSSYFIRNRRQLDDESRGLSAASTLTCDFGSSGNLDLCSWFVPEDAHPNVRWKTGSGSTAYWLGGPLTDKTTDDASGMISFVFSFVTAFHLEKISLPLVHLFVHLLLLRIS